MAVPLHRIDQQSESSAFSRLPQTRSAASHSTSALAAPPRRTDDCVRALRLSAASSVGQHPDRVLAVIAGQGRRTRRGSSSSRLSARSRYRSRTASTNSLRVAMLIRLVTLFCSRRTIRRVASYVRQRVSSGSRTDESMRRVDDNYLGRSGGVVVVDVAVVALGIRSFLRQ